MKNARAWVSAQGVKFGFVTVGFGCASILATLVFVIRFSSGLDIEQMVLIALGINTLIGAGWAAVMLWLLGGLERRGVLWGGLRWGASIIAAAVALGAVNQLAHYLYDWRYPYDAVVVEIMFAGSFTIAVGLVALANVRGLLGHFGWQEQKRGAGRRAGLFAGAVFAVAVLGLHLLGWKVGAPPGVAFKMSKVVMISGALAAFAGGYVLGWSVEKKPKQLEEERG